MAEEKNKELEQIKIEIACLWEQRRLSGRTKLWKFDRIGKSALEFLTEELIRERIRIYAKRLNEYGIIMLEELSPREKKVLTMRFLELRSLEEVGKEFGVTRERIRQLEFKAIEKLGVGKNVRKLANQNA